MSGNKQTRSVFRFEDGSKIEQFTEAAALSASKSARFREYDSAGNITKEGCWANVGIKSDRKTGRKIDI